MRHLGKTKLPKKNSLSHISYPEWQLTKVDKQDLVPANLYQVAVLPLSQFRLEQALEHIQEDCFQNQLKCNCSIQEYLKLAYRPLQKCC